MYLEVELLLLEVPLGPSHLHMDGMFHQRPIPIRTSTLNQQHPELEEVVAAAWLSQRPLARAIGLLTSLVPNQVPHHPLSEVGAAVAAAVPVGEAKAVEVAAVVDVVVAAAERVN